MSSPARSVMAIAGFPPGSRATPSAPTLTSAIWRPRTSSAASRRRRSSRVGSSLNVQPRQRVKDTRAAVVAEAARLDLRPPRRPCSPSPEPRSPTTQKPRATIGRLTGDADDGSDETASKDADEAPGAEELPSSRNRTTDLDSEDSDENAHLDNENPPNRPNAHSRSAPPRSGSRATVHPIVR